MLKPLHYHLAASAREELTSVTGFPYICALIGKDTDIINSESDVVRAAALVLLLDLAENSLKGTPEKAILRQHARLSSHGESLEIGELFIAAGGQVTLIDLETELHPFQQLAKVVRLAVIIKQLESIKRGCQRLKNAPATYDAMDPVAKKLIKRADYLAEHRTELNEKLERLNSYLEKCNPSVISGQADEAFLRLAQEVKTLAPAHDWTALNQVIQNTQSTATLDITNESLIELARPVLADQDVAIPEGSGLRQVLRLHYRLIEQRIEHENVLVRQESRVTTLLAQVALLEFARDLRTTPPPVALQDMEAEDDGLITLTTPVAAAPLRQADQEEPQIEEAPEDEPELVEADEAPARDTSEEATVVVRDAAPLGSFTTARPDDHLDAVVFDDQDPADAHRLGHTSPTVAAPSDNVEDHEEDDDTDETVRVSTAPAPKPPAAQDDAADILAASAAFDDE